MNTEQEIELVELARKIKVLDAEIRKERSAKGVEPLSLREEFNKIAERIRSIIFQSSPIDKIRNPETRDVLRKIRDRNYFIVDKINRYLENYPELLENLLRKHGLEVEVTDSEVDEYLFNLHNKFLNEISEKIDSYEYFERKDKFLPIIANVKLPDEIHNYFSHIKDCFLFGQMFATVGLSRVLLEVGFKDKHHKLGLSKVLNIDKNRRINDIIREVCKAINVGDKFKEEARYLYFDVSSNILHGKDPNILMNSDDVFDFIKRVFNIVEKLYER